MGAIERNGLEDRTRFIQRMIRGLGRDAAEWDPEDLTKLYRLEIEIGSARAQIVHAMRENGTTDKQIGDALGITQQAVSKRWPGGGRYVGAAGRYRKPREAD
jgi:hypothetical protein